MVSFHVTCAFPRVALDNMSPVITCPDFVPVIGYVLESPLIRVSC